MEKNAKQPVYRGELGPLQYAVWRNTTQQGKAYLNVEISRNYRDNGEWQTEKLRLRDYQVVLLSHLMSRCVRDLDSHQANDSSITDE